MKKKSKFGRIILLLLLIALLVTAARRLYRNPELIAALLPEKTAQGDAEEVLGIAAGEVGYHEKETFDWIDSKTANSGTGNYTKYARDLYREGYYNGDKNGYAWCDVFVDWCFYRFYGRETAEAVECRTGEFGAGCGFSAEYYKESGRYDAEPRPGDQIFFYENGRIVHTGLVESVNALQVTVIEGNCEDAVCRKIYWRADPVIAGYGHPVWKA